MRQNPDHLIKHSTDNSQGMVIEYEFMRRSSLAASRTTIGSVPPLARERGRAPRVKWRPAL